MIFLIEYDREQGRIVKLETFKGSDRNRAEETRLNLELDLRLKGIGNEVVLLEAANEEAVRGTHRRYFEDLHQLASPGPG
jgi:hypothetical protein